MIKWRSIVLICLSAMFLLSGCGATLDDDASGSASNPYAITTTNTITVPESTTAPTTTTTSITTTTTITSTPTTASPTTAPTTLKVHPKIVYWGHTGDKIHISPNCRTIKNGAIGGTLDEAKSAGHNGWCGVCSKGWSDDRLLKDGNPNAK